MPKLLQPRKSSMEVVFVLLLFFVFALSSLALVNVGANVYRNIVNDTQSSFEIRSSLSYVATKVRQNDTSDTLRIDTAQGVTALVLTEIYDDTAYETWIYHYEGKLYEQFILSGDEFVPNAGMDILEIADFTIEEVSPTLIRLTAQNEQGHNQNLALHIRTSNIQGD